MIGTVVGGYRIVRQIGEDGMGRVCIAEASAQLQSAAVKVLLPQFSANADIVARFFTEARASSLLHHLGVFDVSTSRWHLNALSPRRVERTCEVAPVSWTDLSWDQAARRAEYRPRCRRGRAYLYWGASSSLGATPQLLDGRDGAGAAFGCSVANAGDVNS